MTSAIIATATERDQCWVSAELQWLVLQQVRVKFPVELSVHFNFQQALLILYTPSLNILLDFWEKYKGHLAMNLSNWYGQEGWLTA